MTNERKAQLCGKLIGALCDHLLEEDYYFVFHDVVGMTDEEMREEELLPNLPSSVELEIDSCLADAIEDKDYIEDYINQKLYELYEYKTLGWQCEVGDKLYITDIEWDYSKD